MKNALTQFKANLQRARELGSLAVAVETLTTTAIDVSDIWRAQVVLAVSALDHFIHELTRLGMIETANGQRIQTDAYSRFPLPLSDVKLAVKGSPPELWLGDAVREKHGWQSFQDPDKIADAVRLFSGVKLWEKVGIELKMTAQDVKIRLKLIVDRRNKIAHEADLDPSNPGFRWQINSGMVSDTIDFLEAIGEAVFKIAV